MANQLMVQELARIHAENGGVLRPRDIVEEARPAGSPLHEYFEWDDGEAAEKWRLHQARNLVRVIVEMLPYNAPRYEVRAYVSLAPDRAVKNGGYHVMAEVLGSPDGRAQLLADALTELNRIKVKYFQLSELAAIFAAIAQAQANFAQQPPPQPPPGLPEPDGDGATT